MKILELRLQNLNSLYGEWYIDFSDPEYVSNGIFVLTGPTGAGKSTILDAICLALYGATPRLGKITKSGNEIMSRQTGECYAEVVFESQTGRYRCKWTQRKARKSPDGNLQDQQHEISDAYTGKLIETKKSLVLGVIEEKTGMDFDRFTRSILLAQGGFDSFLKADTEQKSRILEQITGTEIYSEISWRVHERHREERETLNLLQAETSSIEIMSPDHENQIQQNLQANQNQEIKLVGDLTETNKAIAWLTGIDELKKEINNLSIEESKLLIEVEAFNPKRYKLERAKKTSSLDGPYATLCAIRQQQIDDQAALEKEEAILPALETSANKQSESLKAAEQITLKAKEELTSATPLIQKIRSLDQTIADQDKAVSESIERCSEEFSKIEANKQHLLKEQAKRNETEKLLQTVEQYIKDHVHDEWLIGGLAGIEEQFSNLLIKQKEISRQKDNLKNTDKLLSEESTKLETIKIQCAVCKEELEKAQKNLQQGKDFLHVLLGGKLLREYRTEKDTLQREKEYLTKIAALKDHRDRLEQGKPCPVCGSTQHPFSEGNVPVPDEVEQKIESLTTLINKAEDQEAAIKAMEDAETADRNNLNNCEKLEANAANNKTVAEKALTELKGHLEQMKKDFDSLKLAVSQKLQPLGISEIPEFEISTLLESLKSRLIMWKERSKQKSEIEKQVSAIDVEIKGLAAVIETQSRVLLEKQGSLERLQKEHASRMEERNILYGDKHPGNEENRLNKAIANAEDTERQARILNNDQQQNLMSTKSQVESLKKRIAQRAVNLQTTEESFLASLAPVGFEDEKQFLEARMPNEEQELLSSQIRKLDDSLTELKARSKDRKTRLIEETNKKATDKTLEELVPKLKGYENSLNDLRENIAGLKHRLTENTIAKERIREKQLSIDTQKKECQRWEKLHGLIGSSDGKKYRNFAQGLTFELMISHANRQLEKMSDRYILVRDEIEPLELNVVDNYQAGEIRSTKNLSGGETFIVSLTLALGLSKMSSRKVRVDSLFLDEGFGTLDEDAFETALEALSELHQEGKLIGMISHVLALKERISTQIQVSPIHAGKSVISGPGCRRISVLENVL